MASRTQVVCLHEGKEGRSIDPIFIGKLLKELDPSWLRPWKGSKLVRMVDCGSRSQLIAKMPSELRHCLAAGGNTTLMVWADLDHNMPNGDALRSEFWKVAQLEGITREQFDQVVFAFAKDRIENWIEFLETGKTDESISGPRVKEGRQAAEAAKKLAEFCQQGVQVSNIPPSLEWSCANWRRFRDRMNA